MCGLLPAAGSGRSAILVETLRLRVPSCSPMEQSAASRALVPPQEPTEEAVRRLRVGWHRLGLDDRVHRDRRTRDDDVPVGQGEGPQGASLEHDGPECAGASHLDVSDADAAQHGVLTGVPELGVGHRIAFDHVDRKAVDLFGQPLRVGQVRGRQLAIDVDPDREAVGGPLLLERETDVDGTNIRVRHQALPVPTHECQQLLLLLRRDLVHGALRSLRSGPHLSAVTARLWSSAGARSPPASPHARHGRVGSAGLSSGDRSPRRPGQRGSAGLTDRFRTRSDPCRAGVAHAC